MPADATNLASEFYILSILQRLGLNAALTLGNKKSVDIVIAHASGDAVTIDVKGAAGTTGFFVDNQVEPKKNHFVIFVSYLNKIHDPGVQPEVYIVPSSDIQSLVRESPSHKKVVSLTVLRNHQPPYKDNWATITHSLSDSL